LFLFRFVAAFSRFGAPRCFAIGRRCRPCSRHHGQRRPCTPHLGREAVAVHPFRVSLPARSNAPQRPRPQRPCTLSESRSLPHTLRPRRDGGVTMYTRMVTHGNIMVTHTILRRLRAADHARRPRRTVQAGMQEAGSAGADPHSHTHTHTHPYTHTGEGRDNDASVLQGCNRRCGCLRRKFGLLVCFTTGTLARLDSRSRSLSLSLSLSLCIDKNGVIISILIIIHTHK